MLPTSLDSFCKKIFIAVCFFIFLLFSKICLDFFNFNTDCRFLVCLLFICLLSDFCDDVKINLSFLVK